MHLRVAHLYNIVSVHAETVPSATLVAINTSTFPWAEPKTAAAGAATSAWSRRYQYDRSAYSALQKVPKHP